MKSNYRQFVSVLILFVLIFSQFAYPQPAAAATTRYAVPTGGLTSGQCESWANACDLQTAMNSAVAGDQVWVQIGTYYPTVGSGRAATFTLRNGIAVYGGFTYGETDFNNRSTNPALTILSGDIGTLGSVGDNAYHVVTIDNAGTSTRLEGFTVTGGLVMEADPDPKGAFGAGFYISNSSPTLNNLIITNNQAGNTVGSGGGGMFINDTDVGSGVIAPDLTNVTFISNRSGRGGGLFSQNSNPKLTNVTFDSNEAIATGGGGMNSQTVGAFDPPIDPKLTNVTFINNLATGGGGLFIGNSYGELTNVTFSGNTARRRGGGLLLEFSTAVLTNVTFNNNVSQNLNTYADPRGGGGLMNISGSPTLNNVTFSGNTSNANGVDGGAMRNADSERIPNTPSNPVINNSIFWDDNSTEITHDETGTVTITIRDSVVEGGCPAFSNVTCTNVINADPILGALASNGGYTQTMALTTGSSAIDTGNSATCATTDQRGLTRPQGLACDIGAYEALLPPAAFNKGSPADGLMGVSANPVLNWLPSSGMDYYEYCYDTTDDDSCSSWTNNGSARTVMLSGLSPATTYYWQARAVNSTGVTYANGSETSYWSFTTANLPGVFGKAVLANGTSGASINPSLTWGASSDATTYEYCYDTTNDSACSNWTNNGGARYVTLSGLASGTTYYWQVRASNSFGMIYADGGETGHWSFTTTNLPGVFGKAIQASGASGVSLNPALTWGASSGASTYEYCYDTTNDGACSNWINNGGSRYVFLSGLNPATTYYWQVRAKNSTGTTYADGVDTAYWTFTTVNPPGTFGKAIPANGTTGASINPSLIWGGSSGASTYEYCYDTTNDSACSTWISNGGARSVTLSGLIPATTYYWQVRAVNSAGVTYADGGETGYWSFTTIAPPGAFGKAIQANGASGVSLNPTLTWGAGSGASTYEYCYDTTNDGVCSTWVSTGGARYVFLSGLSPVTTYYWQVRAKNGAGTTYADGAETAYWTFTTINPPGAFGKAILANGTTGASINPTLTWGAGSGASTYEYCYDTTDDSACSNWISNGGARSVTLSGLSPATTYYWQVRAVNSVGLTYADGGETAYWTFTTANPPGTFGKGVPANGATGLSASPTLIWGPSSGVSTYEYCYDTTNDGACGNWISNGGARYVFLSGLTPGTTYYWQVRAVSSVGMTYANDAETAYWNFTIAP